MMPDRPVELAFNPARAGHGRALPGAVDAASDVYRAVGLNPRTARKVARANPHYRRASAGWGSASSVSSRRRMINGVLTKALWRRSLLLGPGSVTRTLSGRTSVNAPNAEPAEGRRRRRP